MLEKPYHHNVSEVRTLEDIDTATALVIEGYALACADMINAATGESPCCKSYDPMIINGREAYSYAFELRDGGRRHDLNLFKNVGEIMDCLLEETASQIVADLEEEPK